MSLVLGAAWHALFNVPFALAPAVPLVRLRTHPGAFLDSVKAAGLGTVNTRSGPSHGGNHYLTGNYAPVSEEVTALDLPVTGTLPPELNGRYLRNGPNPLGEIDHAGPRPQHDPNEGAETVAVTHQESCVGHCPASQGDRVAARCGFARSTGARGCAVLSMDRWISAWARQRPRHEAVREGTDVVTYAALDQRIAAAAADLTARRVEPGDRVGFCGLNRIEQVVLLFACARIGAVLVPLNNRLSPAEHRFQIDHGDLRVVFATDGFADPLADAAGGRPVVDLDVEALLDGPIPHPIAAAGDRDVLMVYTSGTTGRPKGAVHTQRSLLFTVLNGVAHQDLHAGDRILTFLPIFHVGGLNIQTLPALYVGASVELVRRFDPAAVLDALRTRRHTHTLAVPATMAALLAHPDAATLDWSCLRGLNSGSSVVPPSLIAGFHELGVPVGQVYGSTETGPTAVVLRFEDAFDHVGSCGKAALHSELRIVDGELWVRGPHVFDRYWNDDEATAAAFSDGWYRTGDVGHTDQDGFVYVDERLRDVVISGGENIYPAEVELVLAGHPAIAEVAVVGRPDERWGEVVVAYVVVRPDATAELAIDDLRVWCEGRLARFKQPRALVPVDSLPRTALGKVTKHVLRDRSDTGSGNAAVGWAPSPRPIR